MNEEVRYGAGGVPYVGGSSIPAPEPKGEYAAAVEPAASVEVQPEEPKVTVTVTEDDRPLTDEQVVKKVTGRKTK